jgi:serine/threonine-protein kinase HipA
VASLPARTLALHDDSELSLAGLEDKILLVRTPDGWARAGIPGPDSQLTKIGDADCIIVERYDRTVIEGVVCRVHQEDTCQALGIDPAAREGGRSKDESHGGPSFARACRAGPPLRHGSHGAVAAAAAHRRDARERSHPDRGRDR